LAAKPEGISATRTQRREATLRAFLVSRKAEPDQEVFDFDLPCQGAETQTGGTGFGVLQSPSDDADDAL